MKNSLKKVLNEAVRAYKEREKLEFDLPVIDIEYPKNDTFGDYTSNAAMIVGKAARKNPLEVAEDLTDLIGNIENIEKVEAAKPGYLNFYLSKNYLQKTVEEINRLGEKFGDSKIGKGIKINNEFISANPTGPLHLGNGRGGFLGDCVTNVLRKAGYEVVNEYYVNDAGEQVMKLGHSVLKDDQAVYSGEYIDRLNEKLSNSKDVKEAGEMAAKVIMEETVKKTIREKMRINFDHWFSEKELHEKGYIKKAIEELKGKGFTFEKEGALWLKTTSFGDDKDRVLIKKDGKMSYFASDCGYILNKKERKFGRIIEIWGADHHGYVSRFRAAAEAFGFEKKAVSFLIVQMVRLMKEGKEVRMSKRAGNVVFIDELIDKVGHDVARFFFLMYSPDTHMNFDLGLAQERSDKNPVYYVQYAHARISSIFRKYQMSNSKSQINSKSEMTNAKLELLTDEKELNLIRELHKFPEFIEEISQTYEVHKLPHFAIRLADKFHSFYSELLVLDAENPDRSLARLKLVESVRIVLAETLRIIGVSAPERMEKEANKD